MRDALARASARERGARAKQPLAPGTGGRGGAGAGWGATGGAVDGPGHVARVLVRTRPREFRAAAAPARDPRRRARSGRGDETTPRWSRVARSAYKRFFVARRSLAGSVPSARFWIAAGASRFATSTRELALHALAHDGHGRGWRARDRQPAHGRGRGERPRRGQAPRAVGRRQRTARLPRAGFGRRRLGRRHRRFRRLERRRLRRPVVRSRAPRRKRPFPRPREPLPTDSHPDLRSTDNPKRRAETPRAPGPTQTFASSSFRLPPLPFAGDASPARARQRGGDPPRVRAVRRRLADAGLLGDADGAAAAASVSAASRFAASVSAILRRAAAAAAAGERRREPRRVVGSHPRASRALPRRLGSRGVVFRRARRRHGRRRRSTRRLVPTQRRRRRRQSRRASRASPRAPRRHRGRGRET